MAQSHPAVDSPRPPTSQEPHWLIVLRDGRRGDVLALITGAILLFAFAPFDIFPVAVIVPALLFLLWLGLTPRRAFRRGYWFGLGMFGAGVNWVFVSMYEFGGVSMPLSLFLTSIFVLFLALFPALLGYCLMRFSNRAGVTPGLSLALIFPAGWVLFEWIRGWFLTGFPWLNLGYSQLESPLAGLAPVTGVYGVSLAVALTAGCLALLFVTRNSRLRAVSAAALLALWGGSAFLNTLSWTQPVGTPLRVTLLQGDIPQDLKWLAEVREPTLELYTKLTEEHWDSQLIVWPESALPDMYNEAKDFLDDLAEKARSHNTDLLIGLLYDDAATGRYYNSMVSVGRHRQFYHKHHLVPFTEYLPMQSVLGGIVDFMQVPMSDFSKGPAQQAPLEVAGQKAGISICYEDAFGEETIRALPAATLLVNVSNDAWFGHSIAPQQHLQIAQMRALETGRPLLRATNTGLTAIIDPRGRIQAEAPQFKVAALTGEIQPMQGMTPYARVGNALTVVLILVMLAGAGLLAWRRNGR
jgi:apolipoprotein N-acyltransferase